MHRCFDLIFRLLSNAQWARAHIGQSTAIQNVIEFIPIDVIILQRLTDTKNIKWKEHKENEQKQN